MSQEKELARTVVGFWAENQFGITWTESNQGEGAKRVRESWPKTAKAINGNIDAQAGQFTDRIKRRNPVIVAKPEDKNARAFILIDCDGPGELEMFRSYGAPETLTVRTSGQDKLRFYFAPPDGAT